MLTDAGVPAFWRELGVPGLADVHVHFYPDRMLRKVWQYFDDANRYGVEWPITYRWPDEQRVAHLAALGVRAYPALNYAHQPGMAADLTAWSLEFAARTPGCLPSGTFYPEPGALDQVEKALAAGVRVFKAHLQVGAYDPRDPLLDPVWGLLADLAERYDRVHLDTTMAGTDFVERFAPFPTALRPRLRELGLAGRVLLGSDFPNIPYPYAHQLEALARLDLGDAWLRAVCWETAATLFGLPA